MPYPANKELPKTVRGVLPQEAQSVWRKIFNAANGQGLSDESSSRVAWKGVKDAGWERADGGKFVRSQSVQAFDRTFKILKFDEQRRTAFGWFSVANDKNGNPVTDSHGDVIEIGTLEKAVYLYNLEARGIGDMHKNFEGVGRLVESIVFTAEKRAALGIPEGKVHDGWWGGIYIDNEEACAKVASGEYTAFSIGGMAVGEFIDE